MPTPSTSAEFFDLLRQSRVLRPDILDRCLAERDNLPANPSQLAAVLVKRGVLTRLQAKLLLAGRYKGFLIGPYVIREELGRGGMGAVYLAEHQTLRRQVAVKVLDPKQVSQPGVLERFHREARAAAALDHPNIVRIFDVGQHGEARYLVLEFVDGKPLDAVLAAAGRLPVGQAAGYVAQAAAGLQHAHEKGFVHRDIKPANLMATRDGGLKILDMGLARSLDAADEVTNRTDRDAVLGTADYIAPEQALRETAPDIRADVYSLGATFFQLLIGKPPFAGNVAQKLVHHQQTPAPRVSDLDPTLPAELAEVVCKMMAKRPEDRYQTPADVAAALTPWLQQPDNLLAGMSGVNLLGGPRTGDTRAELTAGGSTNRLPRPAPPSAVERAAAPKSAPPPPAAAPKSAPPPPAVAPKSAPPKPRKARPETGPTPRRWLAPALVAVGAAVVGGGGLAAALLAGKSKPPARPVVADTSPTAAATSPVPPPAPPAKADPPTPPVPPAPPAPPAAADRVLYALDLSAQKPFATRGTVTIDGDPRTGKRTWQPVGKTGAGDPPPGWEALPELPESEIELAADDPGGGTALFVRTVGGPSKLSLLAPPVELPDGRAAVRFEYRTRVHWQGFQLRFQPADGGRPVELGQFPGTDKKWHAAAFHADLDGAAAGRLEFRHHSGSSNHELSGLWVRRFAVSAPGRPPADPVWRLDVGGLTPFENRKRGAERIDGGDDRLPAGVRLGSPDPASVGRYAADPTAADPSVSFGPVEGKGPARLTAELEPADGPPLAPGRLYMARIEYRAAKSGVHGSMGFESVRTGKGVGGTLYFGTAGERWTRAAAVAARPDTDPLRLFVTNGKVSPDSRLEVRRLEVFDVGKVKPAE